ncbi:hypothetical protein LJC52_04540 [Bacteroidales bacterium OttesenSCG-928-A17]|nr:hypothetical protein [Bacteroidales bacterium OttesenSCG-928-A17]
MKTEKTILRNEILFGLTPYDVYSSISVFFNDTRMCNVALTEILEEIQRRNDNEEDNSILIEFTKNLRVLAALELTLPEYEKFCSAFGHFSDNQDYLSNASEEEIEIAKNLHSRIAKIISLVEDIGYIDFFINAAGLISEVKTKRAYEDIVMALTCVQILYIAYVKSQNFMKRTPTIA